jgi:hypothetical protein
MANKTENAEIWYPSFRGLDHLMCSSLVPKLFRKLGRELTENMVKLLRYEFRVVEILPSVSAVWSNDLAVLRAGWYAAS